MEVQSYLEKMKIFQAKLLDYLGNECDIEETFQNLNELFKDQHIYANKHELKSLLYLILKICNNHNRFHNFFCKIEKLILLFKDCIKKYFSNTEIFTIFKSNKRILLFLIEEKILNIDSYIFKQITTIRKYINGKYPQYFLPEIQPFLNDEWFKKNDLNYSLNQWVKEIKKGIPENFYELRKKGENESHLCDLIRQDLISEFISYINQNEISINAIVKLSVYETNSLLINSKVKSNNDDDEDVNLIEYSAFYGSIQIFKYLRSNGSQIRNKLFLFSIHGDDPEMISILEETNNVNDKILIEAIKCHHNDIFNYFIQKYDENKLNFFLNQIIKYYNFDLMQSENIDESLFFYLVKYDYYILVDYLLKNKNININNFTKWQYKKDYYDNIALSFPFDVWAKKTALFLAVEEENYEIIDNLLTIDNLDVNIINSIYDDYESLGDSNYVKKTSLYLSVEKGNIEIVKKLLKSEKIDLNILNEFFKCDNGNECSYDRHTALYCAVVKENIEIIKLLLDNEKIDINALNMNLCQLKDPPVLFDIFDYIDMWEDSFEVNNWEDKVEWLIKYQITALFLAVQNENIEIVKLFLNNDKVDVNVINTYSSGSYLFGDQKATVLFKAVEKNNFEIVKILLNNDKIDVNVLNLDYDKKDDDYKICEKRTALFLAVQNQNIDIVNLLLNSGKVDVDIMNGYVENGKIIRKTAKVLAIEKNISFIK